MDNRNQGRTHGFKHFLKKKHSVMIPVVVFPIILTYMNVLYELTWNYLDIIFKFLNRLKTNI